MEKLSLVSQAAATLALFTNLNSNFSQDITPDEATLLPLLEDQYGRFNIWARNVGVFASGHASLDYRLREDPQPRVLVGGLLEGLQDQLQRGKSIKGDIGPLPERDVGGRILTLQLSDISSAERTRPWQR